MWTELEQVDLKVKLIFFKNSIATGKSLLVAVLFLIFRFRTLLQYGTISLSKSSMPGYTDTERMVPYVHVRKRRNPMSGLRNYR